MLSKPVTFITAQALREMPDAEVQEALSKMSKK